MTAIVAMRKIQTQLAVMQALGSQEHAAEREAAVARRGARPAAATAGGAHEAARREGAVRVRVRARVKVRVRVRVRVRVSAVSPSQVTGPHFAGLTAFGSLATARTFAHGGVKPAAHTGICRTKC